MGGAVVNRGKTRSSHLVVPLVAFLLAGTQQTSASAAEPPETIDPSASCSSGECHSDVEEHEHIHWPKFTEIGACQKCHQSEGDLHQFSIEDPPDLCVGCHEDVAAKIKSAKTVHDPAEDCTDCHGPHGGTVRALLLEVETEDDLKPLCFGCHDEDMLKGAYAHGPAEQGECTICHDPHASSANSLLLAEGAELCGDCHDEVAELVEESEYVHSPVEDGCPECHNPHSGPNPFMLSAKGKQLCNEFHDDIAEEAKSAAVDHAPALDEAGCLNCHTPHASNVESNLLKPQQDLCLSCHNEPVESGDSTLIDMQEKLLQNKEWHEPIREEGCSGCHQPHGSANFRLLKKTFPPKFYANFDLGQYALCFSCHENLAMTVERTRTLTSFRDGNRNLHYLHVNKARRGRTCRACHELHASPDRLHIREQVQYGTWLMPIHFEKNENGGSCHPGCHSIKVYDRDAEDYSEKP
jgi:predicted CXXCH cytochrome family protein